MQKVIIIDLSTHHYKLVVLKIAEKEIVNVNGLSSMPFNSSMVESLFTEQNEPALGKYVDYEKNVKPFLVQNDTVSCGPIAALAFHFEYAGRTLFEEVVGTEFETSLRGALVEAYAKIYGALEGKNSSFRPSVVHDAGLGNFGCAPQTPQDPINS